MLELPQHRRCIWHWYCTKKMSPFLSDTLNEDVKSARPHLVILPST
jgi:hypothetical protein